MKALARPLLATLIVAFALSTSAPEPFWDYVFVLALGSFIGNAVAAAASEVRRPDPIPRYHKVTGDFSDSRHL